MSTYVHCAIVDIDTLRYCFENELTYCLSLIRVAMQAAAVNCLCAISV